MVPFLVITLMTLIMAVLLLKNIKIREGGSLGFNAD
jgi:hypothetical protein